MTNTAIIKSLKVKCDKCYKQYDVDYHKLDDALGMKCDCGHIIVTQDDIDGVKAILGLTTALNDTAKDSIQCDGDFVECTELEITVKSPKKE